MPSDVENPEKSMEKDSDKKEKKSMEKDKDKKKKTRNSFLRTLRDFLTVKGLEKYETEDDKKVPGSGNGKVKGTGKATDSRTKQDKEDKKEKGSKKIPQNSEEDPTLYFIDGLKDHEKVQSIREKKKSILKAIAIVVSIILIIIAVVYSLGPTEEVASNVIFGERAMFSVLLILIAFLILSAVFASKLREHKFFKKINKDLEILEGKDPKDDHVKDGHKNHAHKNHVKDAHGNSDHDQKMESMDKKNK